MYNIGTVTTTANSTKLVGTGTKWKENINLVLPMQSLQVQIGNTVYNNSIHSIQSNTELTLNFPLPIAQAGAKYVIFTTTMDSISAATNANVAMNVSNVQFSDIQNRIMTETGVIDVKLPDGTVRKTRTEAERDKLLDGKFDKAGGALSGRLSVKESLEIKDSPWPGVTLTLPDNDSVRIEAGRGNDMVYFIYRDKDGKSQNQAVLKRKSGIILTDLDYYKPTGFEGYGGFAHYGRMEARSGRAGVNVNIADDFPVGVTAGITTVKDYGVGSSDAEYGALLTARGWQDPTGASAQGQLLITNVSMYGRTAYKNADNKSQFYIGWKAYTDKNTTKDSNGNLKAASPIIKVFADHIELNEESEGVELEKLDTGRYKLKGVLGMNSDASWGGIHGGMVIPNGINNLPLVWGSFDVLPDGDIIIETRYRKHELNERQEAERLMTYPEFLKDELVEVDTEEGKKEKLLKVEREDYEYCDIPNGHWIDVRVNMPSNSIYNLKQAEAERLAKEAAEKQAEEEAKREAEEAERAEQEAEAQTEQQ
ncbi:hypothetical protein [Providencia manganoxydans]|uniref:phage tail fiber protein n=1 Tax=Providencia manganoxydans TaxID=2923283 RepID=UPI0032DB6812